MGNKKDGFNLQEILSSTKAEAVVSTISQGLVNETNSKQESQPALNEEGKILQETFEAFSKHGLTVDEKNKLKSIDDVLDQASIQLTKDSGAIVADSQGHSSKVKPRFF